MATAAAVILRPAGGPPPVPAALPPKPAPPPPPPPIATAPVATVPAATSVSAAVARPRAEQTSSWGPFGALHGVTTHQVQSATPSVQCGALLRERPFLPKHPAVHVVSLFQPTTYSHHNTNLLLLHPTPPHNNCTHHPGTRRVSLRNPLQPPIKPFARATQPDAEQVHSRSVNAVRSANPTNVVRFTAATSPTVPTFCPPALARRIEAPTPPLHTRLCPTRVGIACGPKARLKCAVPQSVLGQGATLLSRCPPVSSLLLRTHVLSTNPRSLTHFAPVHSALSMLPALLLLSYPPTPSAPPLSLPLLSLPRPSLPPSPTHSPPTTWATITPCSTPARSAAPPASR